MMGLSDGERILMMRSAVLTQIMCVTDGLTDGIGVAYIRAISYMLSRVKTRKLNSMSDGHLLCDNVTLAFDPKP